MSEKRGWAGRETDGGPETDRDRLANRVTQELRPRTALVLALPQLA